MRLQGSRTQFRLTAPLLGSIAATLAIIASIGETAAAAPLFPTRNPAPAAAPAGADRSTPEDVVVDTQPQPSGSTPPDSTNRPSRQAKDSRFTCENRGGQYMVMYHPESQPGQAYPWANPGSMGGGWTPDRRCNEISRRLEGYRPDGLQEMRTGLENGYNIVCVTTERVPGCRIVLTVPPGQDPSLTRDRVFQNLTVADAGQQTQAVNTYIDNGQGGSILSQLGRAVNLNLPNLERSALRSDGIDLRPFLDRTDGGTGTYLRPVSKRPASRLNPNQFR